MKQSIKPYNLEQLKKIVQAQGTVRITKITESLEMLITDPDDDYEEDSIDKWEKIQGLANIACSDAAFGNADSYHNLAVEFAKLDFHECAIRVLEKGLKQADASADLLADMILYGIEYGRLDKCDIAYDQLMRLERAAWGWRAYSFVIKYYLEYANKYPNGELRTKCKNQAISMAKEFIEFAKKQSPKDIDRAYFMRASVHQVFGGEGNKDKILLEGISSVRLAPQCSLGLADSFFERGEYDEALKYLSKCNIATKKPQPDINAAYAHLLFALSKTQRLLENQSNDYKDKEGEIKEIYKHFHIAIDAYDADSTIKNVANQTIKAIRIQTEIEDDTKTGTDSEYI